MVLITIKSGNDPQFLFDIPAKEGDHDPILNDTSTYAPTSASIIIVE